MGWLCRELSNQLLTMCVFFIKFFGNDMVQHTTNSSKPPYPVIKCVCILKVAVLEA